MELLVLLDERLEALPVTKDWIVQFWPLGAVRPMPLNWVTCADGGS